MRRDAIDVGQAARQVVDIDRASQVCPRSVLLVDLDEQRIGVDRRLVFAVAQHDIDIVAGVQALNGRDEAAVCRLATLQCAALQTAQVEVQVEAGIGATEDFVRVGRAVVALDDLHAQAVRVVVAGAAMHRVECEAVGAHHASTRRVDVAPVVVEVGDADRVVDFVGELDVRSGADVAGVLVVGDRHDGRLVVVRNVEVERRRVGHAIEDLMVRGGRDLVDDDHLLDPHVIVRVIDQRHVAVGVAEREQRDARCRLGQRRAAVGLEQCLAAVVVDDVVDRELGTGLVAHALSLHRHVDGSDHLAGAVDHQQRARAALQHDIRIPDHRACGAAAVVRTGDLGQQCQRIGLCQRLVRGVQCREARDARGGDDGCVVASLDVCRLAAVAILGIVRNAQAEERRRRIDAARYAAQDDAQVHALAAFDQATSADHDLGRQIRVLARGRVRRAGEAARRGARGHIDGHAAVAGASEDAARREFNVVADRRRGTADVVGAVEAAVVHHDIGVGVGEGQEAAALGNRAAVEISAGRRGDVEVAAGFDLDAIADRCVVLGRVDRGGVGVAGLDEAAAGVDRIRGQVAVGGAQHLDIAARDDGTRVKAGAHRGLLDDLRIGVSDRDHAAAAAPRRDGRLAVAWRGDAAQRDLDNAHDGARAEQLLLPKAAGHVEDHFVRLVADSGTQANAGLGQVERAAAIGVAEVERHAGGLLGRELEAAPARVQHDIGAAVLQHAQRRAYQPVLEQILREGGVRRIGRVASGQIDDVAASSIRRKLDAERVINKDACNDPDVVVLPVVESADLVGPARVGAVRDLLTVQEVVIADEDGFLVVVPTVGRVEAEDRVLVVDIVGPEQNGRRIPVGHTVAVGKTADVDEIGRDGPNTEVGTAAQCVRLVGKQLDRVVIDHAHVVGRGLVQATDQRRVFGVVANRVAVGELVRRAEADHVASRVDADVAAGLHQRHCVADRPAGE